MYCREWLLFFRVEEEGADSKQAFSECAVNINLNTTPLLFDFLGGSEKIPRHQLNAILLEFFRL
jgi:hypothetical protein